MWITKTGNTTNSIDFMFFNSPFDNTVSVIFVTTEDDFLGKLRAIADEFDDVLERLAE